LPHAGAAGRRRDARGLSLTEEDEIVVGDFENTTGDAVFDDTLRQALIVQLRQSQYLNIVSDDRVCETLVSMRRRPDEPLTAGLAREVCERQNVKATLTRSIARLGTRYVVAVTALEGGLVRQVPLNSVRPDGVAAHQHHCRVAHAPRTGVHDATGCRSYLVTPHAGGTRPSRCLTK
jgi:hypothetical protein